MDGCLLRLAALYVAVAVVYILFEKVIINYRPVIMEGDFQPEASFPSSHTMLACTIYLSASMILDRYVKNPRLSVPLRALCVALAVITVLGRFASGVHWFTDILGGILLSTALLFVYSGAMDVLGGELWPDTHPLPDLQLGTRIAALLRPAAEERGSGKKTAGRGGAHLK